MYSKAKIKDHPLHPMLVAFPITFYTMTLVAFVVYQFFNSDIFWFKLGYFCNFAGVAMAALAAIPGFIDWAMGIPNASAAKKRGLIHMGLNVTALVLFAGNAVRLYGNWNTPFEDVTSLWVVAFLGVALTMAAGYHGWELIATHKVGVSLTPEQERLEPVEKMNRKEHQIDARPRTV